MRRREFIAGLGGVVAWPVVAQAQQPSMPVIGFLHDQSPEANQELVAGFHRGLAENGYVEGRNLAIEFRWARGQNERLPALAADLVRHQVAVIAVPGNTEPVLAAQAATQTIPIVFAVGIDPVEIGFVASLNRPGGNLTGVSILNTTIMAKRVALLHELVPVADVIALLFNPANSRVVRAQTEEAELAARILGIRLVIVNARSRSDIETAFTTLVQQDARALVVSGNPLFIAAGDQLVTLAARHEMPTMYQYRDPIRRGALSALVRVFPTRIAWLAPILAAFSRARSPPICRCSRPQRSS
jgi:putative ABC transport system substrate-binding protein